MKCSKEGCDHITKAPSQRHSWRKYRMCPQCAHEEHPDDIKLMRRLRNGQYIFMIGRPTRIQKPSINCPDYKRLNVSAKSLGRE